MGNIKYNDVIRSISYDQHEILYNIMKMHNNGKPFDCDITYSSGKFYGDYTIDTIDGNKKDITIPQPKFKFDVCPQNEDIIDVEAIYQDKRQETLLEFTERYIDKFTTLQETMYNELRNRDNQILLLTTSEKSKQEEHFKTEAENKTLKQKYNVMRNVVITLATLLVILTTFSITFFITERNVSANVSNVEPVIEETSADGNIIIPDTKKAATEKNR